MLKVSTRNFNECRTHLAVLITGCRFIALGLSLGALKTAIHRLRGRYRALLREEVARTVAAPAEVDEEVRYLRPC